MKKILFLGVLFTLAFSLAACDFGSDDPDPVCTADQTLVAGVCEDNVVADTTAPVLTGVIDKIIYVDETFNNLNGVSSIDDIDGDITAEIIITGTVDVTKAASGTALSAGTAMVTQLVPTAAGGLTAATNYNMALHATEANYTVAAGDIIVLQIGTPEELFEEVYRGETSK